MNFFALPVFSFVPPKYRDLVKESGGKIFGALLICFLVMGIITGMRAASVMNSAGKELERECPDFSLKNGVFSVDKPYKLDEDNVYFEIDDSIEDIKSADVEKIAESGSYESIMIIGRNGAGIMSNGGQYQVVDFSDFGGFELSRDILFGKYFPMLNTFIIVGCTIGAFFSIGIYYLVALILQYLTGLLSKNIFNNELSETDRFRLTVLGKFPPHVLIYIIKFTGLHINLFINLVLQVAFIILVLYFYNKDNGYENYDVVQNY
jgi:hypothetical protein